MLNNPKNAPKKLICRVCDTELCTTKTFFYIDTAHAGRVAVVGDRKTGKTIEPNCHQCGYSYNLSDTAVAEAKQFEREFKQLENQFQTKNS